MMMTWPYRLYIINKKKLNKNIKRLVLEVLFFRYLYSEKITIQVSLKLNSILRNQNGKLRNNLLMSFRGTYMMIREFLKLYIYVK